MPGANTADAQGSLTVQAPPVQSNSEAQTSIRVEHSAQNSPDGQQTASVEAIGAENTASAGVGEQLQTKNLPAAAAAVAMLPECPFRIFRVAISVCHKDHHR